MTDIDIMLFYYDILHFFGPVFTSDKELELMKMFQFNIILPLFCTTDWRSPSPVPRTDTRIWISFDLPVTIYKQLISCKKEDKK